MMVEDRYLLFMSDKEKISERALIKGMISKKSENEQVNEEKVRGYVPKNCDFKCYKCRYQGVCILPRRLIEARRRYAIGVENKNLLFNRKYRLNSLASIFLNLENYGKVFRSLVARLFRLNKEPLRYRRKSKYER